MTTPRQRVVILGGGFGGVYAANTLAQQLTPADAEITLVNRDNFFVFQPLLPEVVSGSVEANHILTPLRLLSRRVRVHVGDVEAIDPAARTLTVRAGPAAAQRTLAYDHLLLALGSVMDLSALPGLAQHGLTVKTIGDAFFLRNHIIRMLEEADLEPDATHRRAMLTFLVAGGGFTGVEVAAEVAELVRRALPYYPSLRPEECNVILLHSGARLMPELPEDLAAVAQRVLDRHGIRVLLRRRLQAATATEAVLQGGESIPTRTLICSIGTATNPLVRNLPLPKERGRIVVDRFLRVPDHPGIWALGDAAAVPGPVEGEFCPPSAQFAMRQGVTAGANIAAALAGRPLQPFAFRGLGQMVSLGRRSAVADVMGWKLTGFAAWWLWRTFYLLRLPGASRKVRVALDWTLDLLFGRDICELQIARSERVTRAHYEPGETIVRQGDPGDSFYIVEQGYVEVIRHRESGEALVVAELGPGEFFGEQALLSQRRRNATVRARTAVDVIALGRDDFRALTGHWQMLRETLSQVAADRVTAADADAAPLETKGAP